MFSYQDSNSSSSAGRSRCTQQWHDPTYALLNVISTNRSLKKKMLHKKSDRFSRICVIDPAFFYGFLRTRPITVITLFCSLSCSGRIFQNLGQMGHSFCRRRSFGRQGRHAWPHTNFFLYRFYFFF